MRSLITTICALLLATSLLTAPAGAAAGEMPWDESGTHQEELHHDRIGVRTGLLLNGLFGSDGAPVFRYFDFALRNKSGEYYVDLRMPTLALMIDAVYLLAGWATIGLPDEPLLMTLNPSEPGYLEAGHGRLGYRFRLIPPDEFELWSEPLEAAVGFFGSADLLFFGNRSGVDPSEVGQYGYDDPLILGAGAFIALGRTTDTFQYDIAFGVGRGIRGVDNNPEREVTIFMADADLQFAPGGTGRLGWYVRPRLTGYHTRLDPGFNMTTGLTAGVNIGF